MLSRDWLLRVRHKHVTSRAVSQSVWHIRHVSRHDKMYGPEITYYASSGTIDLTPELDMDWIHPWIGLDRIGSGFWGNFVDWVRRLQSSVFFHLYIFYINNCRTL